MGRPLTPAFRGGLPLIGFRQLTDADRDDLRRTARAAARNTLLIAAANVLTGGLCGLAWTLRFDRFASDAVYLAIPSTLCLAPLFLGMASRPVRRLLACRKALSLGRFGLYEGRGRDLTAQADIRLANSDALPALFKEHVHLEVLSGLGLVWRANDKRARGWAVLDPELPPNAPVYSPTADLWGFPDQLSDSHHRSESRPMLPKERARLGYLVRTDALRIAGNFAVPASAAGTVFLRRSDDPNCVVNAYVWAALALLALPFNVSELIGHIKALLKGQVLEARWLEPDDANWPQPESPPGIYLPSSRERLL